MIDKNLSCNSKNLVYIIECRNCKKAYIGLTQALSNRISLQKKNSIKLSENRKLFENTFTNAVTESLE